MEVARRDLGLKPVELGERIVVALANVASSGSQTCDIDLDGVSYTVTAVGAGQAIQTATVTVPDLVVTFDVVSSSDGSSMFTWTTQWAYACAVSFYMLNENFELQNRGTFSAELQGSVPGITPPLPIYVWRLTVKGRTVVDRALDFFGDPVPLTALKG